jgi:predicted transposase/invertase (TIGR01784 family)
MIFINPKTDFAFKKIFGSTESKDILISFLNALLYQEQPVIIDLEILNPYLAPKIRGVKDTYLDIKAKITGDRIVIIEMQVLNVEGFEKRILYNAAKSYSIQLGAGQDYNLLNPVIALTITDFKMFPNINKVISSFGLKEKDILVDYPIYDLELVFVELPKFQKKLEELETIIDKWLYFLKNAATLPDIPEIMDNVPEIKHAFSMANQATLSRDELEDQQMREIYIQDQKGIVTKALSEGLKQGIEQGIKQGVEQGIKQGVEQGTETGSRQKAIEIARNMLGILDHQTISLITGLTIEEITDL